MRTFQNATVTDMEGFIPDLIYRLSQDMGFEYEIYLVPDGNYGSVVDQQGTWNGMIGEVTRGEVGFRFSLIHASLQD